MEDTATPAGSSSSSTPSAPTSTPAASTVNTVGDASAALAFAESSLANPETSPESTPASAEVSPVDATAIASTPDDDPRSPFIPRTRFDAVNERMTKAEEQLKQYDWAKDIPEDARATVPQAVQWAQALNRDPVGTIAALTEHAARDPQMAAALRSHMGRLLSQGRQQAQQTAPEPEPEADLQAPDGTLAYSQSQQKLWREWNNRQLTAQLTQQWRAEIQPLKQVTQAFQKEKAAAEADRTVSKEFAQFRKANPEFTDALAVEVHDVIKNDPKLFKLSDEDPGLALETAWNRVYRSKVLPAQQKSSEGKVLANLQQRAVLGTMNPAAASPTTPASTLGNARAALMAAGVE